MPPYIDLLFLLDIYPSMPKLHRNLDVPALVCSIDVLWATIASYVCLKGASMACSHDRRARFLLQNIWKIRLQLTKPVTWVPLIWGVLCGAAASGEKVVRCSLTIMVDRSRRRGLQKRGRRLGSPRLALPLPLF